MTTLPRLAALPLLALGVALATLASPGSVPVAGAAFNPTATLSLSSTATNAAADMTFDLTVPGGDYAPHLTVLTSPWPSFVAPGPGHTEFSASQHPALGTVAGTVSIPMNLGLTNTPCASNFTTEFTLLNATVNKNSTITPSDSLPAGRLENLWLDASGGAPTNGLPAQVDRYPSFLNSLFTPDGGSSLQPLARYAGATNMAGTVITLNVVVFDYNDLPNGFEAPNPFDDFIDMGYTMVAVFGDPTAPNPGVSVTDICSPLGPTYAFYGQTKANACNGVTSAPCDTPAGINAPDVGSSTGRDRYGNPYFNGTHLWFAYQQSERDTDGDGTDNTLDSCPMTADSMDHRLLFGDQNNDIDLDGLPNATVCDGVANLGNSDHDSDGVLNTGDNCPKASNGSQSEFEYTQDWTLAAPRGGPKVDRMGDACETGIDDYIASG